MSRFVSNDYSQIKHLLERDNIDIMLKNYPGIIFGNTFVAACCVYSFSNTFSFNELMLWLLSVFIISYIRLRVKKQYQKNDINTADEVKRWRIHFIIISTLAGAPWAYAAWFFMVPTEPLFILFMGGTLMGVASASVGSNAGYFPVFLGYSIPFLLTLSVKLYFIGGEHGHISTLFMVCLILGFTIFAYGNQRATFETLRLRYQNKELLEKLEGKNSELSYQMALSQEANRQKSQFLAAASHDLRQPLQSLTLFNEILSFELTDKKAKQTLGKIEQSIKALNSLFNALLDISQLDAGAIKPNKQAVCLNSLFNDLQNTFSEQANVKGITFTTKKSNLAIDTDLQLIKRCLSNLIINAIKHSKASKIQLFATLENENVIVNLHDNGQGIAPAEHKNIFMEFHQLDNPERKRTKGLGLGLAIVKHTCKLLKHDISITSDINQGCEFQIKFTRSSQPPSTIEAVSHAPNLLLGIEMLVIDDEDDIREGLKILLTKWGVNVTTAADDNDVKQLIEKGYCPSMIISDYRLPKNITGAMMVDLYRKSTHKNIPAILITGDTAKERIKEAQESQLLVLHKPVQPARLKIALTDTLHDVSLTKL